MKFNISPFERNKGYVYILYSALFISSFNIISIFFEKVILGERLIFADFSVYRCGAITFLNNINPYKASALSECLGSYPNALDFFYPPFTLNFFSLFSKFSEINSIILWGIILLPIIILNLFLMHKLFFKKKNFFLFILIYFFSFGGLNFTGLLTGNITIVFYSCLGISFYYAIINKNTIPIFFILTIMSLFKITYLIFLVLFFFLEKKKYFKFSFITLFAIVTFYLFSYLNDPKIFLDFINHLSYIRSNEFFNLYGGGFGLYSIIKEFPSIFFSNYSNHPLLIQLIWILICSLFLLSTFLLIYTNKTNFSKLEILSIGILTISICYPVIKDYEGFLLVPCIYYLLFNLNFKSIFKNNAKVIQYIILFLTFSIHDKYILFLTAIALFFLITYINFKNNKIFIKKKLLTKEI